VILDCFSCFILRSFSRSYAGITEPKVCVGFAFGVLKLVLRLLHAVKCLDRQILPKFLTSGARWWVSHIVAILS
jgi:hypothetical protein